MFTLLFFLFFDFILYLYIYKNKKHHKFYNIIEKYFYFLIAVFISYILLAYLKKDYIIFIEYLKDATILTLKIVAVLLINTILLTNDKIKNKLPKKLKIRINFIINSANYSMNLLNNMVKKYKKLEIIKNMDKILTELIIGVLKNEI